MNGVVAGLKDSMAEYGSPMVFTVMEYEGIEGTELLRPIWQEEA